MPSAALRFEQLGTLSDVRLDGNPVLVHGSIGHAALMGEGLPSAIKTNGDIRDVDVFSYGKSRLVLEDVLSQAGISQPHPVDAGLCDLLVRTSSGSFAQKHGVVVPLDDRGVFDEIQNYEIPGTDGLTINSFTPAGLLAVQSLEPCLLRVGHMVVDIKVLKWFRDNDVELPKELHDSIEEFHRAYRERYPHGNLLLQTARVYSTVVPEKLRSKLRPFTHKFMREHAGRESIYVKTDD